MMDDFGSELEEIRREIVESRALSIKTNNLVNALAADVNSIAKRQQGYERRMVMHSSVTYVVSIAGLLLTTDSAIVEIKEKKAGVPAGGGMDDMDY